MQMSDEREQRDQSFVVSLSITGTECQRWAGHDRHVCLSVCAKLQLLIALYFEEMLRVETVNLITNIWKSSRCYFLVTTWITSKYRQIFWGFCDFVHLGLQRTVTPTLLKASVKCSILAGELNLPHVWKGGSEVFSLGGMKICPATLPFGTSQKAYLQDCGFSVHLKSHGASEWRKALTFLLSKKKSQRLLGKCSLDRVPLNHLFKCVYWVWGVLAPTVICRALQFESAESKLAILAFCKQLSLCVTWHFRPSGRGNAERGNAAKCYGETRHRILSRRKEALFSSPAVAAAHWQPPLVLKGILAAICSDPPLLKFELGSW